MRFDMLEQVMLGARLYPRITLAMVADGLRKVIHDPIDAERKVGHMYGHAFKKREELYDAMRGRVPPHAVATETGP
jgi:hypothetical protein